MVKVKKHLKSEVYERKRAKHYDEDDDGDESSFMETEDVDSPAPMLDSETERPLKMVLKLNVSDRDSSSERREKRHKHKKKKKKKDLDRERGHAVDADYRIARKESKRQEEEASVFNTSPSKRLLGDDSERRLAAREAKSAIRALNSEQLQAVLVELLSYLQKVIQRKDVNAFFAYPVNDVIAPGYSSIIADPMDFSTMRCKIDNGLYPTLAEYTDDFKLMCRNAMTYNHPDTIYYKAAQKLLHFGVRQMSRDKINQMRRSLPFMSSVTADDLGVADDEPLPEPEIVPLQATSSAAATNSANNNVAATAPSASTSGASLAAVATCSDDRDVSKPRDTNHQSGRAVRRERCLFVDLVPVDALVLKHKKKRAQFEAPQDNMAPDEILKQAQAAARAARDKLTLRAPNSKLGFLRRREDGSTTLRILNPDNTGMVNDKERVVNLGSLHKLTQGGASIPPFKEDKRNLVKPVSYLDYGAFSSFAPSYDSSHSNLTKDESDLLLNAYGDSTCQSYAASLQNFVEDSGDMAIRFVDNLLDILTHGAHSETKAALDKEVKKVETSTALSKHGPADAKHEDTEPCSFLTPYAAVDGDDVMQGKLNQTADLLAELRTAQYSRLGQKTPHHLRLVPGPSSAECDLADKVTKGLAELAKQVAPGSLAPVDQIRRAMGIALEPNSDNCLSPMMNSNELTASGPGTEGETALEMPSSSLLEDPEDTFKEFFDSPVMMDSPSLMVSSTGSPMTT